MSYREIWNHNGRLLGYPECCIASFCNGKRTKEQDEIAAGMKGFIPCPEHAKQIVNGEIKIEDLIKGRDPEIPPYPRG